MKKFALIIALLIAPFIADAQHHGDNPSSPRVDIHEGRSKASDANIFGHILDAASGEHIPYATVAIKGTTIGCAADATGHYNLNNLPVGEHTIVVSAIGYQTIEQPYTAERRRSNELNFRLEEQALLVDEVVVSATRNQSSPDRHGSKCRIFEGLRGHSLGKPLGSDELPVGIACGEHLWQLWCATATHQRS